MELGAGSTVVAALIVCVAVWFYGLLRESRHLTRHSVRWFRMVAGLSLMSVAVAGAAYVIRQDEAPLVEPRGYGVAIDGVDASEDRKFDVGLALAQSVRVASCDPDERATVTLQIAPTAEFWIDHLAALRESTRVDILIPNAGARVQSVSQGAYGVDPFTRPVDRSGMGEESTLVFSSTISGADLRVEVEVPAWSTTREPLRLTFTAPFVERRGLGTCYVDLPALTGLPTVVSGSALENLTRPSIEELESTGRDGVFIVSSETGIPRFAYYEPRFEITRGVTVLDLGEGLVEDKSQPSPDANFSGAPAWTCRSKVARELRVLEAEAAKRTTQDDGSERREPFFAISTTEGGTYALSGDRIDEVLDQQDCAARIKISAAASGYIRDVLFLFVGALFSAGAGLLTSSVRRRRISATPEGDLIDVAPPAATTSPFDMRATMRRARSTRKGMRRHHLGW